MKLSGNIPFFIQIICKNCGPYAIENKRRSIGFPELEKVTRILTGTDDKYKFDSKVAILPENPFQNNQYGLNDPKVVHALISSIAYLDCKELTNPYGAKMSKLEKLWHDHEVSAPRQKLYEAIKILVAKRIITKKDDEGDFVYKISVDLFRRWWYCHHPDIQLELASISEG
jgi:hypothetical protein